MNISKWLVLGSLVVGAHSVSAASVPDKDVEIDALKRISNELRVIKEMLTEAQRYQSVGDPNPFLYNEAGRDLNLLIMGFDDYIDGRFDPTYEREPLRFESMVRGGDVVHRK